MRTKTIILLASVLAVAQLTACGHSSSSTSNSTGDFASTNASYST